MLPIYQVIEPGRWFGRYFLLAELGTGSFGVVYRARQMGTRQEVALKIAREVSIRQQELFREEAGKLAELYEEYIVVQLYDCGVENNRPFLALNYLPHTLAQKYQENPRGLPADVMLSYLQQAARGLQSAHDKQIMHLDIKPENLLISSTNQLQISDFGIAVFVRDILGSTRGAPQGTKGYRAPEQVRGRPCFASDQYSLAVVVYEGLTGRRWRIWTPWLLRLVRVFAPGASEFRLALLPVVLHALARDPRKRFEKIQDFAAAFEQAHHAYNRRSHRPTLLSILRPFLLALLTVFLLLSGILWPLLNIQHVSPPSPSATNPFVSEPTPRLSLTATAMLALYQQATSSPPTFSSTLNSQQANWDQGTGQLGSCLFVKGSYEISVVHFLAFMSCIQHMQQVTNFALQVELVIKHGDYGGLLFRYNRAQNSGYRLLIGADTNLYRFAIFKHGRSTLLASAVSSAIQTTHNQVTVIARGDDFFLYINQQFISEVRDPEATFLSGSLGLVAEAGDGTFAPLPTVVDFHNLRLWLLS